MTEKKIIDRCYSLVAAWSSFGINSDDFAGHFHALCDELKKYDEIRFKTAFMFWEGEEK